MTAAAAEPEQPGPDLFEARARLGLAVKAMRDLAEDVVLVEVDDLALILDLPIERALDPRTLARGVHAVNGQRGLGRGAPLLARELEIAMKAMFAGPEVPR